VGLAHLGTADATTLAACLHRLKGAAATLGHAALADAAADAELLWRCDGQPAPRATAAAMQALDAVVAQVGVLAERAAPFLAAGDADGWPMVISRTGAGPSSRLNTADQAAPVRAPNGSQEPAGAAEGEPPGEAAATAANAAGATAITPSTERVASDRLQALMGAMLRADLVAQVHFDALKPWLRQRLAAPAFQALCAQFDALDYAGALPVLKALAESQAPTD
jgi:chemotaxis protein histidine kinase CheA